MNKTNHLIPLLLLGMWPLVSNAQPGTERKQLVMKALQEITDNPNLKGAVVNTHLRHRKGKLWFTQRDVGSSFGVRFLASYYDHCFGEKAPLDIQDQGVQP